MMRKKMSLLIVLAVSWIIVATPTGAVCAENVPGSAKIRANNVYYSVNSVVNRYISALQTGDSNELKTIFLPESSYYYFREGKLVGGNIDILYKAVEGSPIPKPIIYEVTSVQVSGKIASVTLDIRDLMGVHIIDMFTLVQDDTDAWRITSKVARRQN